MNDIEIFVIIILNIFILFLNIWLHFKNKKSQINFYAFPDEKEAEKFQREHIEPLTPWPRTGGYQPDKNNTKGVPPKKP